MSPTTPDASNTPADGRPEVAARAKRRARLAGAVGLVAFAGVLFAWWQDRRETVEARQRATELAAERDQAKAALDRAEAEKKRADDTLWAVYQTGPGLLQARANAPALAGYRSAPVRRELLAASSQFRTRLLQLDTDDVAFKRKVFLDVGAQAVATDPATSPKEEEELLVEAVRFGEALPTDGTFADDLRRLTLARLYHNLGRIRTRVGAWKSAEAALRAGLAHLDEVEKVPPQARGPERCEDAADTRARLLARLAEVADESGDPAAGEAFRRALDAARALAAPYPKRSHERRVAVTLNASGRHLQRAGNLPGARAAFEESVAILERLAKAAPPEEAGLDEKELAPALGNLAAVCAAEGDHDRAAALCERVIASRRKTFRDDDSVAWVELASALNAAAGVLTGRDPDRARKLSDEAVPLAEQVVAESPTHPAWGVALAEVYFGRCRLEAATGRTDEALRWADKAVDRLETILTASPTHATARQILPVVLSARAGYRKKLGLPAETEDDRRREAARRTRAATRSFSELFDRRDFDGALAVVEDAVKSDQPELLVGVATVAAHAARLLAVDPGLSATDRPAREERFATLAVHLLQRRTGMSPGLPPPSLLDRDWDPLRDRPDFRAVQETLNRRPGERGVNLNGAIRRHRANVKVSASSEWGGYPAAKLIDGRTGSSWYSGTGDAPAAGKKPWVEVKFPTPVTVRRVTLLGVRDVRDVAAGVAEFGIREVTAELLGESGKPILARSLTAEGERLDFDWVLDAPAEGVVRVRVTVLNDSGRKKAAEACVGLAEVLVE